MAHFDVGSHNETTGGHIDGHMNGHCVEEWVVKKRPRLAIRNSDELSFNQIQQLLSNCFIHCLQPIDGLIESAHQLSLTVDPHPFTPHTTRPHHRIQSDHKKRKKKKKVHYTLLSCNAIEAIRDVKLNNESKLLFRINYKGYGENVNSWQTSHNLIDCDSHYQHYYSKQFAGEVIDYGMNDFYRFAICLSKTVGDDSDTAVVLKLNDITIKDFNRTDKQLQQLKHNISRYFKALKAMHREMETIEKSRRSDDHFWPQKILIQYLVREMKIETNFGGLRQFFAFVKKRKKVVKKLKRWEKRINKQLSHNGFPDDRISVENNVDLEILPEIRYLSEYRIHPKVKLDNRCRVKAVGCKCSDNHCIANKRCDCDHNPHNDYGLQSRQWYAMYECNDRCNCSHDCPNRCVQKGSIGTDLVIFRTSGKGWGVMTRKAIPRHSFVTQYLGEVIDSLRIGKRVFTYFFNIDAEFCGQHLFIDAEYFANIARFVNHSCEPNLDTYVVVFETEPSVPRIGFFANRDIKEFEELTYDYNFQILSIDSNGSYVRKTNCDENVSDNGYTPFTATGRECGPQSADDLTVRCLCGAKKCRQFILK